MTRYRCRPGVPREQTAEHVADAHRDALAAYRAIITDDRDGLAAILAGNTCGHCLAVTLVLIGLSLAVRGPGDLGPGGAWSDDFQRQVLAALAATQRAVAGLGLS